jgi:hypothetical protein
VVRRDGILENLYTVDQGVTQTLVEHGFDVALVPDDGTNIPATSPDRDPSRPRAGGYGLFAFVKQSRVLSTYYVKELHQVLTAHQTECDGVDPRGMPVRVPLLRGDWKVLPNNPADSETMSILHEYCPPEQVASEMDRLIAMHARHSKLEPELSAAWLHHRFTQIHPFQDGNGRVARALATLVLLQAHGLPLVVRRDDKKNYIDALRTADDGDLEALVRLFCELHKRELLNALQASDQAIAGKVTVDAILEDAGRKLRARQERVPDPLRALAVKLRDHAARRLEELVPRVQGVLPSGVRTQYVNTNVSGPEAEKETLWPAMRTAQRLGYVPDAGGGPWARLNIRWSTLRSRFLVHFHRVGSATSNVMAANVAFSASDAGAEPATTAPFTFTADSDHSAVLASFDEWLERALVTGLELWRRSL